MPITSLEIAVFLCFASFVFLAGLSVRRFITTTGASHIELQQLPASITSEPQATDSLSIRLDRWLHRTVRASGIGLSTSTVLLITICAGVLTATAVFLFELPLPLQVVLTSLVVVAIPIVLTMIKRYQLKKFSNQLPPTLDLLARAVQAGESLESAFSIASKSSKEPIKKQLGYCVKQFELGSSASSVMANFADRVPTMEMKIFAHTVSVHRELGGRLANGLERLAAVIRDRREYIQKVNSMTSLGRFSIAAISLMGVFILLYLIVFHPDYLNKLLSSELGLQMAAYAVVSEIVGLCWIFLTLKSEP